MPAREEQVEDLDQKIAERSRSIAANPGDARAHRDRGLFYARKRLYDEAMGDLNIAISLNPNDAHAYGLRGLVWEKKGNSNRAIEDFDKAITLDSSNSSVYQMHREKLLSQSTGGPNSATVSTPQVGLGGFFKKLAQYYAEFLSTDFKKQRLPRRRLQNSDAQGRLVGIPLRKYPGFQQRLWEELAKPIGAGISMNVSRGTWRSALPKAVAEAIETYIGGITQDQLDEVVDDILTRVQTASKQEKTDPVVAFEKFVEDVRAALAKRIIGPLLDKMEGFFARTENKPIESLSELLDQLSARLSSGLENSAGAAFSALLVDGSAVPIEEVLRDQLEVLVVRTQLQAFFDSFSASDLYVELSDLVRSSRLIDNVDFYMHIAEIHHGGHVFPSFYIPFTAERTENGFSIMSETRLYANKRAIDFVAQEVAKSEGRASNPSPLNERIFYLSPDQRPVGVAQKIFDEVAGAFNLRAEIDFKQPRDQEIKSAYVAATNRLSFSIFDRSDESMVNDYEALITGIETNGEVVDFFKSLIDDFLLSNPVPIRGDVEREWDEMTMPQRLVFDSPLPLAEEQRKLLSAIKHHKSRFIAGEGPPGTGKSHTITAVAFDLILGGKSVLVLSDKKEALDVVEDKLNQALSKVRPSEDFPNPILRLGKDASNYAHLLKKSAIERLQVNQGVVRQKRPERERALSAERENLTAGLEKTVEAYAKIDLLEIAELERDIAKLVALAPDAAAILADDRCSSLAHDVGIVAGHVRQNQNLTNLLRAQGVRPSRLLQISTIEKILRASGFAAADFGEVRKFSTQKLDALNEAIERIENLKKPIFGYLLAGKHLRRVAKNLREQCNIISERPDRDLPRLRSLRNNFSNLREELAATEIEGEFETAVFLVLTGMVDAEAPALASTSVLEAVRRLDEAVSLSHPMFEAARDHFYAALTDDRAGKLAVVCRLGELKIREADVSARFSAVPKVNYISSKAKIESLNTQHLAERIDERLIEFHDNKKNDAMALGKIIREKQRFPIDKFADIQRAFPCIIAGLRDYAEFIPLEREIFDLVIIDEASQVSIAQALPAIIRAKKVLVLGDRNQFGNVKTSNASKEVNAAFMQDLLRAFAEDFEGASESVRTKIDLFNVKSSVLDFIEPISNFSIQLKKHFRSYPEMIGFSSKYFYGDSLQVMKIRGKPIEEVIEFDGVAHDGLIDKRNVNVLEAKRIVERLSELLELESPPSVGVVTPHTEQQSYIAKLCGDHSRAEEFYKKLRLKVMTFDTCQGEEREIIFYSLVATEEKDRLAYIFPSKLDRDESAEVDHNLRLQRLNVGLSRGQERLVFVHSKPTEQYASALRVALQHYRNEVERAKSLPTADDVDSASPMEQKVVHWLSQVPIIRDLGGDCEVIAQFELGRYLRQLDPSYRHPDYRVDFLIRVKLDGRQHQLVLEYDGFEFHFDKDAAVSAINSSTWRSYLTADDLEREKVLESFGVQMIRLNRFNTGKDPVATIDALLREKLEGLINGGGPHDLVAKMAARAGEIEEGLKSGKFKRCRKCDRDLPVEMFADDAAKTGVGRHCRECKAAGPKSHKAKFRRSYRF